MAQKTNCLIKFWQELKRRNVFKMVAMYAATAYIIIEVVNNLVGPLHLPYWITTLVVILLIAGLPIVVILSWIFDFTPEGIKKTKLIEEVKSNETETKTQPVIKRLRVSNFIIAALMIIVVILAYPKIFNRNRLKSLRSSDGKISVAVMPFNNLTGDTTLNWFERGISSLIINGLGNSSELSVADEYTMFDVFESMNQVMTGGMSGSMAKEVARKVGAETYISGSFQGKENLYWILVNFVNTKTGDIIWTNKVKGDLKSAGYLDIANLLCNDIKNNLEIKALEENVDYDFREAYPQSSEAYRYFIEGMNAMMKSYNGSSILSFKKALEIDSTFTFASFFLAWAYSTTNQDAEAKEWTLKAYQYKNKIIPKYQPWLEQWYAFYVSKKLSDILRYTYMLQGSGIQSRWLWYDLGTTYCNFLQQYEKAINAFEKVMAISHDRGGYWKHMTFYINYSKALHKVGKHKEEKDIYRIYQNLFPDNEEILGNMATCFLSMGDTIKANDYLEKIKFRFNDETAKENFLEITLGNIYQDANILDKAEDHFRKAYETDLQKNDSLHEGSFKPGYYLARLLINNDINIREGIGIADKNLEINPENPLFLGIKGWGLYKQGQYDEAIKYLKMSEQKSIFFDLEVYQYIQEVEKAIASQKNN
jgi:tetratricopeptide (TPR) repeat protein